MIILVTRDRIVQAATAAFMRQGFAGTGLKQVVVDSEATVGSLYHFFPGGKAELAAEVLRTSGAAYQALVEGVLDGIDDPVEAVRRSFRLAATHLAESGYADACPVATVALEVASSDDALRQVCDEVTGRWLAALRRRLRAAGASRSDADRLATTYVAALEGGFLLSRVQRSPKPLRALGDSVAALVAAALATP